MIIAPMQNSYTSNKKTNLKIRNIDTLKLKNDSKEVRKLKEEVLLGSILGVAASLFYVAKKQKLNMFKWKELKKISLSPVAISGISACSILGGLITGLFFDKKEYRGDKLRESTYQFVGNTLAPITAITGTQHLYRKIEKNLSILQTNKDTPFLNRTLKKSPYIGLTLASLLGGIVVGNKLSNWINNKIFNEDINRGIKLTDFLMYIDDLCIGLTLLAKNTSWGAFIEHLIPFALVLPGFMTGAKEEEHGTEKTFDFKKLN